MILNKSNVIHLYDKERYERSQVWIRDSKNMEQTQICKLNPITFDFDIDIESAWLNDGFLCTISLPFDKSLTKMFQSVQKIWIVHEMQG